MSTQLSAALASYTSTDMATDFAEFAATPAPESIAREIVEDLTAALVEFEAVAAALEGEASAEDH